MTERVARQKKQTTRLASRVARDNMKNMFLIKLIIRLFQEWKLFGKTFIYGEHENNGYFQSRWKIFKDRRALCILLSTNALLARRIHGWNHGEKNVLILERAGLDSGRLRSTLVSCSGLWEAPPAPTIYLLIHEVDRSTLLAGVGWVGATFVNCDRAWIFPSHVVVHAKQSRETTAIAD